MTDHTPPILTQKDFETDAEYQEYLAVEAADYTALPAANEQEKSQWKTLADQYVRGQREKISLNVPKRNLARIKARALEEGLPYQTLINAVLQKWLQNDRVS